MQSSRVMPHERTGAITSRSGASARVETSKRTWSLPLPVQPWPTAVAPWRRAAATSSSTMIARDSTENVGQAGPVEGRGHDVGGAGRSAQDGEVGRMGRLDEELTQHLLE